MGHAWTNVGDEGRALMLRRFWRWDAGEIVKNPVSGNDNDKI
jgi:hypothetical protein